MEICHLRHAELRMRDADLVIRPDLGRAIDVLDFDARRECIAAGERAFARQRQAIRRLLGKAGRVRWGRDGPSLFPPGREQREDLLGGVKQ